MANNMQNIETPVIGIKLLEILMLKLYNNPRCIFREYIQNALDSINEAVKLGVLPQIKDGRVSISITNNDINIEDNGTGIRRDLAIKTLTDIANSAKNGVDTAGQYGLGRLSGGAYCEILEFETTYQGENVATIVSINTRILRQLIERKQFDISAEEAMQKICSVKVIPAQPDEHRFVVRLKNVINSREVLLDVEEIRNYITEYAPIDYSALFNTLINNSPQTDFVKRHKQIDKIRVSLNEYSDIEKGYGVSIKGTGDLIDKIRYFELPEHPKYGFLGWGWYAVTEFSIQINEEKDPCCGIRLRKHNISLDKNILNDSFKEPRGNKYFYGEIFITNDNIVPDSGRQGLAAGEEADALMAEIRRYFSDVLHLVYHRANKLKKSLDRTRELVEKLNNTSIPDAIAPLKKRLHDNIDDFNKIITPDVKDEINDIISIYRNKYNSELKSEVEMYLAPQQTIHEIEPDILDMVAQSPIAIPAESYSVAETPIPITVSTHSQVVSVSKPTNQQTLTPPNTKPTIPIKSQTAKNQPKSKVDEILSSLDGKEYTPEQVAILKRVFSTMLVVCSSSNKKNVILLMEAAVNSL